MNIYEPLSEALITALRVGLIIFPVFVLIDVLNHKFGHKIEHTVKSAKKFMPLVAALLGMLPGCNVGVVIAILFTQGFATLGTLIAAIIAISDEAIYVFIPLGFKSFLPILLAKFVIAVTAGYLIDFLPKVKFAKTKIEKDIEFCCAEHPHHEGTKGEIVHALKHSLRVFLIVLVTIAIFNLIQDNFGLSAITNQVSKLGYFEPILASLIGLIPGCGTSVAIATLYLGGAVSTGAAIAGLATASGEVFVVLLAKGVNYKLLLKIAAILVSISSISGIIINILTT